MGHYSPPNKISNDFFDSLNIGSEAHWIQEKTGISQRYSVLTQEHIKDIKDKKTTVKDLKDLKEVETLASMGKKAWLKTELINHPEILICGTSIPDFDIPANASTIAHELHWFQTTCFDVNSACSSFVTGLQTMTSLLKTEVYNTGGLFTVERYTTKLDYQDKTSCILFGDGATVAFLSHEPAPGFRVIDTLVKSDPTGFENVCIPYGGNFSQTGRVVQKFAISKTHEISLEILKRNNISIDEVDYFISHQANLRMLQTTLGKLGIPSHKHLYNVDVYANQGGVSAPSVLAQNWYRFKPKDLVLLAVVGAGLTWGAALLEWNE